MLLSDTHRPNGAVDVDRVTTNRNKATVMRTTALKWHHMHFFDKRSSKFTVEFREISIIIYLRGSSCTNYAARMETISERVLSQEIPWKFRIRRAKSHFHFSP